MKRESSVSSSMTPENNKKKKMTEEENKDFYGAITSLSNELLLKELKKSSPKNVVVSELSFAMVLSMVAIGASGHTLKQILNFLGFKNDDEFADEISTMMEILSETDGERPEFSMVNDLWLDKRYSLHDSFKTKLEGLFKSEAKQADFIHKANEVVEEANSWAKSSTKGLIQDILRDGDISPDTILLLANALYFKGIWDPKHKFDKRNTKEDKFFLLNGDEILVPFMSKCLNTASGYYGKFDGFDVLKLYYTGREFAMYFFLPDKKNGLQDLLKKFKSNPKLIDFDNIDLHDYDADFVHIKIPKFKFSYFAKAAASTMMDMGLTLPFDRNCREFDKMVKEEDNNNYKDLVNISNIVQKAFIEVDEEGTKAAAVTMFGRGGGGLKPPPKVAYFEADHPFLFMIVDFTGRVLFSGALLNPIQS